MVRALTIFLALVAVAGPATAQQRCRVSDPSTTPLNVRTAPYGAIIATLPNDKLVTILERAADRGGRPWVRVAEYDTKQPIGWVYREFVSCY